jgi:hypothetical protein
VCMFVFVMHCNVLNNNKMYTYIVIVYKQSSRESETLKQEFIRFNLHHAIAHFALLF